MVKKCLGSIHLPEKHSLLYLSMLLRQELFTQNKNRRNEGGRKKLSLPHAEDVLAEIQHGRAQAAELPMSRAETFCMGTGRDFLCSWIKKDRKCLSSFYGSPNLINSLHSSQKAHDHLPGHRYGRGPVSGCAPIKMTRTWVTGPNSETS